MGMPPAKRPPSCGGPGPPMGGPFEEDDTDGPLDTLPSAGPFLPPSRAGALLSLVTVFFKDLPAWICCKRADDAMVAGVDDGVGGTKLRSVRASGARL